MELVHNRISVQLVKGRQDMNCYKICLAFVHYILQDVQPCELVLARLK